MWDRGREWEADRALPLRSRHQSPSLGLYWCQRPFSINPVINRNSSVETRDSKAAECDAGHITLLSVISCRKWYTSVTLVWRAT